MRYLLVLAISMLALVATSVSQAATSGAISGGANIQFANSAAAHNPNSGIPSFEVSPGTSLTFQIPDSDGQGNTTITETSKTQQKSFAAVYGDAEFTITQNRYQPWPILVKVWKWSHFVAWQGNGTCVTARLQNSTWSIEEHHGWVWRGPTSYVVNHIDACNAWFNGRQGSYQWLTTTPLYSYPWHVGISYAWMTWRTYDWGVSGT